MNKGLEKEVGAITLSNKDGRKLLLYKVEGSADEYCVGVFPEDDHFNFMATDVEVIKKALDDLVYKRWENE